MANDNFNPWYDASTARKPRTNSQPKYDVRITLNKSGDKVMNIRFGFHREAAKVFEDMKTIEISSVKKSPNRIYFRAYHEDASTVRKASRVKAHTLSRNTASSTSVRYTTITPTAEEEKIYRMNWVNNTYDIKFDAEHGFYYIENQK